MAFSSPRHTEGMHSSPRYHLHHKLSQVLRLYSKKYAQSRKQLKYDLWYIWEQCWNFSTTLYLTHRLAWKYRSINFLQSDLVLSESTTNYLLISVPHQIL